MASTRTSTQRVKRRRDKLREEGLRPVQIWVPDTRAPGFADECRRQCLLLASPENRNRELDAWLDESNRLLFEELDREEGR